MLFLLEIPTIINDRRLKWVINVFSIDLDGSMGFRNRNDPYDNTFDFIYYSMKQYLRLFKAQSSYFYRPDYVALSVQSSQPRILLWNFPPFVLLHPWRIDRQRVRREGRWRRSMD
jgi:hypothetical protein